MAKSDKLSNTYPVKIRYQEADLGDSTRLSAFQKQTEQAFRAVEKAIGDIYNTENAENSALANNPLYINSLGRALGSMANLVPPLANIQAYSPTLAGRLDGATYNVIPHPDQAVKCEVGCKSDSYDPSDATPARKCLLGYDAFYGQQNGTQTGICQTVSCPGWSGRDGQLVEFTNCDPNLNSNIFREYKVVLPTEQRTVDTYSVKYYSNCGASYFDKFRSDTGQRSYDIIDKTNPSNTWAQSTNAIEVSGTSSAVQYDFPSLSTAADYVAVLEVPALDIGQTIRINGVALGSANGSSTEPSRYSFDLSALSIGTSIKVIAQPTVDLTGEQAALSQIWIIEKLPAPHRNQGVQLLLPSQLDDLSPGTEIPPNFVQIFDTHPAVNRMLDKAKIFATRFNLKGAINSNTNRDSFNIKIYDNQSLEIGSDRYLAVTVGLDVATTVGALLDAFVEHVNDTNIHMTSETGCLLLQDTTFCCEDSFNVGVASLTPSNREAKSIGTPYKIESYIYGGLPPYTVTVDWGDGLDNTALEIVSGVQVFTVANDKSPNNGQTFAAEHIYNTNGTFTLSYVVTSDAAGFGCTADISNLVSPFNVGSPPSIDLEVRLDQITSYPNYIYLDVEEGYSFIETTAANWTLDPNYHVLTQVHNTDEEDGKPQEFSWVVRNDNGLIYQFYYEDVTAIASEDLTILNWSGTLAQGFIQQDSLVLKSPTGQIYEQDVDYTVNWVSGIVAATIGASIAQSPSTPITASYYHYDFMTTGVSDPSDLTADNTSQWIAIGDTINTSLISLNTLGIPADKNTIRFKLRGN